MGSRRLGGLCYWLAVMQQPEVAAGLAVSGHGVPRLLVCAKNRVRWGLGTPIYKYNQAFTPVSITAGRRLIIAASLSSREWSIKRFVGM
jgi:hypothetical protein